MRYLFPFLLLLSCFLTLLPGCEPKEDLVQTSGKLEFEQDTVLFDTVFTTIGTVTKRLWVHNRNSGAVRTDISLAGNQGITYSLIIDGDAGPSKSNVLVRGNDSLLILVKAQLGGTSANKPFLLTDQLNFLTNGNQQNVKLVAYGQNAYFHRADVLRVDTTWPNDKPHVIINSAYNGGSVGVLVAANTLLTILPGTRIYCHAGATMQINGTLQINPISVFQPAIGDTTGIVRFQGDRLEKEYQNIPGQWGGIVFTGTSRNNIIRFTEIRNANFGTEVFNDTNAMPLPTLRLENVAMYNISGTNPSYVGTGLLPGGIVGLLGDISATNCLLTNCGEYAVLGYGGRFNLNFCTFANYTPSFRRETAALTFANEFEDSSGNTVKLPLSISLTNSIVWGSIEDELALLNNANYYPANASFGSVNISNCILRTKEYAAATDATDKPGLNRNNNAINENPNFRRTPETAISNFDYHPTSPSPAITGRNSVTAPPIDLTNRLRSSNPPVIGAYEKLP